MTLLYSNTVKSIYPLKVLDERSQKTYLIESWQNNLVTHEEMHYQTLEANYPQTFFSSSGEIREELQTALPLTFQTWQLEIPLEFRQAVGILAGYQARMPQLLILRLMKQHPHFKDWILQLAGSEDGAYLRLMIELAQLDNSPLPVLENWLMSLPGQPRHQLLGRLANIKLTASQAKKTRKLMLDSLDWQEQDIKEFLYYTQDTRFQKQILNSAEFIRLGALGYCRKLPNWLWLGKLWQMLSQFQDRAIQNILPPLILEASQTQQPTIIKAFKTLKTAHELEPTLNKLVNQLMQMQPFPRAPFLGNKQLIAIDSAPKLKKEGQIMQHCVGGYVNEVVRGQSYFYHWTGDAQLPIELTLQLKPFPKSSQWQLYEALGYQNQSASESDWDYLKQQIANLNQPWGYLLVKSKIAGTDYSDYTQNFEQLKREMPLQLCAEPENPYDANAIRIQTQDNMKLGYLPKEHQATLQPYLAKNTSLNCRLNYLKPHYATVNIYLAPNDTKNK